MFKPRRTKLSSGGIDPSVVTVLNLIVYVPAARKPVRLRVSPAVADSV